MNLTPEEVAVLFRLLCSKAFTLESVEEDLFQKVQDYYFEGNK